MTINKRTGSAVLIASLLGSTAVYADVTAQQVWDAWKANMSIYGAEGVTFGTEEMSGDTLTVSGSSLNIQDGETTVTADLGDLTFTELGDGTVSVGVPETTPMTIQVDPTFGTPFDINMTLLQEGVEIIVGGSPEEMTYDLTAARYGISVDSVEGEGADADVNAAELTISDVAGSYVMRVDTLRHIDYSLSAGVINMVVDMAERDGPGMLQFLGNIDGLETQASVSVPAEMDMEAPESAFVDGLSVDAGYAFGASNYSFAFNDAGDMMQGTASAEGGRMAIQMDETAFSYSGGATAPQVAFEGGDVPFPVEVSMAEYGYGLSLPLSATDEPVPFGLNLLISELSVSDMLWSMVDPGGMLDHGPATVDIAVTGEAELAYDVLDPAQMQQMMMADMPGELHSLDIERLTVRAAGAEVMGNGAFTFDNTDLDTFGGVPRPEGSGVLEVNGLNGLIDTLVQMGLIPEDQVMAPRMMIGMFAQVVGDDMLRSELEVNAEGHVIVNGQRIQ